MVEDLYYKAMHYNFDGIRWEPTDVSFTNEEAGEAMNSVAVAIRLVVAPKSTRGLCISPWTPT